MKLRYISDRKGITRGVYIPIADWNALKSKYQDIGKAEECPIPEWHKELLAERLEAYENGLEDVFDLEEAIRGSGTPVRTPIKQRGGNNSSPLLVSSTPNP
ncbi:addiction module protein [Dyadobacter sp. 676]|uniref:Addiction module protein n=1 Tax=Dyadobacter sp. 676 TaxID=3088362 RepID=A0AAU8FUY3_9BACT